MDSNRFTITDYTYEDAQPAVAASGSGYPNDILSPSPTALSPTSPSSTSPTSTSADRKGKGKASTGSAISHSSSTGGSGRLQLHRPSETPVYPPLPSSTSSTFPSGSSTRNLLSPSPTLHSQSAQYFPPGASERMMSSSTEIRPLPSIPRSFSSSSARAGIPSTLSPPSLITHTSVSPISRGSQPSPRSPGTPGSPDIPLEPLSPDLERNSPFGGALSPPPISYRHSGVSGVSDMWSQHEDEGGKEKRDIPAPPVLTRGISGAKAARWWDKIFPSSTACRLLLLVVVLETIIDLTIEGNILWRFNQEVSTLPDADILHRRLPVYLVIYGLAHLWQLVLTVIAIRTRNTVQVIAVTAFNFAFLAYAIIQIFELRQLLGGDLDGELEDIDSPTLLTLPLNILTAVVIGVVSACCVALLVLSYCIRREFGWQRYRFLGADLQIRKFYLRFQVYECVCYFSAFFCAGFGIQFIWLVLNSDDVEYIVTWVAFPLLVLWLVVGRFAAKYEHRIIMGVFMAGLIVGWAYFIFKLVRIWQQEETTFRRLTKSLTVFNILSLISLIACFGWGVRIWLDFGKGLREAVLNQNKGTSISSKIGLWGTRSKTPTRKEIEQDGNGVDLAARRISID